MSHQMQCFIFICIISLLEHGYIVYTTFMQIFVLIYIHRIDLNADIAEIFAGDLYCFSNVFYI